MATAKPLDRQRLSREFLALGLCPGDVVLVHSSLSNVGKIDPSPSAVVEALLDVVGSDGTIVAPTIVPALRGLRPIFDIKDSPSEMGRLTEEVRKWPGALRSNNATHSVAAIGKLAAEITENHDRAHGPNSPWGPKALGFDSPWDRLRGLNAWVLLLGVGFNRCTILHHVQARYKAKHNGETATTPWPEFDFAKMGDHLHSAGIVKSGKVGNAECYMARAADIVERALGLLEDKPEEFFADSPSVSDWNRIRDLVRTRGRVEAATFKVNVIPKEHDRVIGRPLFARGVLIRDPRGAQAAIVLFDHVAMFHGEMLKIRTSVSDSTGIPVESVVATCTHTHYGFSHLFRPDPGYVDFLAETAASASSDAMSRMEPVRAGWTTVETEGVNSNRTVYLKDGRAYTERWLMPSTWHVNADDKLRRGPSDHQVRLLVLERLDRSRIAVLANFSCHNSGGLDAPEVQDDFFGIAAEIVERTEANGCVALVTPGSQGDQDPTAMIELGGIRDMAFAARLGKRLGGYILTAIADLPVRDAFGIGSGFRSAEVRIRDDWQQFLIPELQTSDLYSFKGATKMPAHVGAIGIGEFALAGIPAELFTEPGRRIRERSTFAVTSAMSLSNGLVGYVAERDAFFPGSYIYGVHPYLSAIAEPGSDSVLVDAALSALDDAWAQANA